LRLGEHVRRVRRDGPLAEAREVDRPEDLVRLREARQEVLEVAALDRLREVADERALRGPGRAVEEQVLARDDRDGEEVRDLVASDEAALERVRDLGAQS